MALLRGVVVVLIPPEPGIEAFLFGIKSDLQKLTSRLVSVGIDAAIILECEEDDGIVSASLQSHIFVHVYCSKSGDGQSLIQQLQRSWGISAAETVVVMVGPRVVPDSWRHSLEDCCLTMWRVGQPVSKDGPHLQSLPQVLPLLVQRNCEQVQPPPLVVGVVMKSSRYRELARRGAFPVLPTDGLCFFPLDMSMALDRQGPLDAVLQRLTDNLEPAGGERGEMRAVLSKEAARLQGYLAENPEICVVEPIEDWKRVIDRIKLDKLLQKLPSWQHDHLPLCRPPRCITADDFGDVEELYRELSGAGIVFPVIVKPAAACGIPGSHRHALVFSVLGLQDLQVGRPACIQEYVCHGGVQHKVYVAGNKMFVKTKESTPDLSATASEDHSVVYFDGLKEFPPPETWGFCAGNIGQPPQEQPGQCEAAPDATSYLPRNGAVSPNQGIGTSSSSGRGEWPIGGSGIDMLPLSPRLLSPRFSNSLNWDAASLISHFLIKELDLHLFGFDVVVDVRTGDHVVVDVNYLPNFKGIDGAPEAIRSVIKALIVTHKQSRS